MAPKFAFMYKLHLPRGQEVHTLVLSGLQMKVYGMGRQTGRGGGPGCSCLLEET
ncbi:hypothetical protein GQ55_8G025100 [Panicum hallii var. hallii]|uniref:Uncharacterized protein n=2 Tax=Panicum hallii TaxID=206008 RepID=A0A2T7CJZ5_9POAL|nr:hypothetical protein PAHAL_8G025200 [Panicum hallii]PUZ43654.1 hypothetical protein GQ55_8G025100 [Panicum hallii var. hallii]